MLSCRPEFMVKSQCCWLICMLCNQLILTHSHSEVTGWDFSGLFIQNGLDHKQYDFCPPPKLWHYTVFIVKQDSSLFRNTYWSLQLTIFPALANQLCCYSFFQHQIDSLVTKFPLIEQTFSNIIQICLGFISNVIEMTNMFRDILQYQLFLGDLLYASQFLA